MQESIVAMFVISRMLILRDMAKTISTCGDDGRVPPAGVWKRKVKVCTKRLRHISEKIR